MGDEPEPIRRLTARSAILSVLLGIHPGQGSAALIVELTSHLGVAPSTARAALSRLAASGDLDRNDGVYRLSARLIERQRRQDFALRPVVAAWDGSWRLALVTTGAENSTDRAGLRATLRAAKFGELREGVWGRPNNITPAAQSEPIERLSWFTATPDEDPAQLAGAAFELENWARSAEHLIDSMNKASDRIERFRVSAAIVRHIHDDPLLPAELLPTGWPGDAIRHSYEQFRAELRTDARTKRTAK